MVSFHVVIVCALVAATKASDAVPSASEVLELLDEWNLGMFRPAFEQKNIDGYALLTATKEDLDNDLSDFGAIHRRALHDRAQSLKQTIHNRRLAKKQDWDSYTGVRIKKKKSLFSLGEKNEVKIALVDGVLTIIAPSVNFQTANIKINGKTLEGKDSLFKRVAALESGSPPKKPTKKPPTKKPTKKPPAKQVGLWAGTANTKGNHNFGKSFTTLSSVGVPHKSTYLVLSSYRIRHNGNAGSFVAARLTYPGGSSKTRMVIENFNPTSGFNNYGGSVSWLARTSGGGTINAQYKTTDGKGEGWVNDSNGIPETLAVDVGGAWTKMQDSTKGTHTLSSSMKTMATVSVPSAGTYLVISNYRIRVNDHRAQSFVSAQVRYQGKNTRQRMICENLFTPGTFNNIGGQVSWMVKTTAATNIEVQYRSTASKDIWYHDTNGIPSTIVVLMSDSKKLWTAKADAPAGAMKSSWVNAQTVKIPSGGKYLVLSNYRIWLGSKQNGFVKARVVLGSKEVGKVKMITERMHPTRRGFINYGGMMGWVVKAPSGGTLSVQYYSTIGGGYRMVNDGNGVPNMQIYRLS